MRPARAAVVLVAAVALLASSVAGPALGGPAVARATSSAAGQADATAVEPAATTLVIDLARDGDATVTVSTRFRIEDGSDRRAFESLAASFTAGDAPGFSVAPFRRALANNTTDRRMRIREVTRNATTNESGNVTVGVLRLSFVWTNFARVEGTDMYVGDAFNTTRGPWLSGLAPNQTLVLVLPEGYGVIDSPPDKGPQRGVFRWDGPRQFQPGYFDFTFRRGGVVTTSPATPPTTTTPGEPGGSLVALAGLFGVGVAVLAVVAVLWSRRDGTAGDTSGDGPGAPGGTAADGATTNESDGDDEATDLGETADGAAGDDVDVELLSDEERVERLLERNGGRMKQASIVKETGWSNAKVSQLLSSMAEEGRVDKLRIGRENLISLPDEDVTDIDEE